MLLRQRGQQTVDRILSQLDDADLSRLDLTADIHHAARVSVEPLLTQPLAMQVQYLVVHLGAQEAAEVVARASGSSQTDPDIDAREQDFHSRLLTAAQALADAHGMDYTDLVRPGLINLSITSLAPIVARSGIKVEPSVTEDGALLLQWRREDARVAMIAAHRHIPGALLLHMETPQDQQILPYDAEVFERFLVQDQMTGW